MKFLSSILLGVMAQSLMFPIRYIVELLNKQSHIILTGKKLYVILCVSLCVFYFVTESQVSHLEVFWHQL